MSLSARILCLKSEAGAQSGDRPKPRFAHTMAILGSSHSKMVGSLHALSRLSKLPVIFTLKAITMSTSQSGQQQGVQADRREPGQSKESEFQVLCLQDVVIFAGVNSDEDLNEVAVWKPAKGQPAEEKMGLPKTASEVLISQPTALAASRAASFLPNSQTDILLTSPATDFSQMDTTSAAAPQDPQEMPLADSTAGGTLRAHPASSFDKPPSTQALDIRTNGAFPK